MARIITGRVEVRVNGQLLLTKTGAKAIGIGGFMRKAVLGESLHGFVDEASERRCEFSITDTTQLSLTTLADTKNATVVFSAAEEGGKNYILRNAYCEGNFELTAGEGEVPVAFVGEVWEEQMF